MHLLRRYAFYLVPVVAFLGVFWPGIGAWFQQDDFAHLKVAAATSLEKLPEHLITVFAQGTFRPLSERLFYWVTYHAFGLETEPARIFCFVLQAGNCLLLAFLLFRLTGSRLAAGLAASAWAVHPILTLPLTWVATTNQVMWAFSVLATLCCFVVYVGGANWRFLVLAWIANLTGFGILESNVAVPALVTMYVLLYRREKWRAALLFWIPALVFAALHLLLIPKIGNGTYGMKVDFGMFPAAWHYWRWLWLLEPKAEMLGLPGWSGTAAAVTALAMALWLMRKPATRPLALLAVGWFVASIGPVLPLQGHLTDYYMTVPAIAVALLFAAGFRQYPRAALGIFAGYLAVQIPVSVTYSLEHLAKGEDMRALVLGAGQAQANHPGSLLLIDGISDQVFWSGVYDNPFGLVGAGGVKLTPESAAKLLPYPELFHAVDYTLPPAVIQFLHQSNRLEVYEFRNRRLTHKTLQYTAAMHGAPHPSAPDRIEAANALYSAFLGPQWHPAEEKFRWMPRIATATMEGPGRALVLSAFCVPEQAPLKVSAKWEGLHLGEQSIPQCGQPLSLRYLLPAERQIKGTLQLEVSPIRPLRGDNRELGLAVRSLQLQD